MRPLLGLCSVSSVSLSLSLSLSWIENIQVLKTRESVCLYSVSTLDNLCASVQDWPPGAKSMIGSVSIPNLV